MKKTKEIYLSKNPLKLKQSPFPPDQKKRGGGGKGMT